MLISAGYYAYDDIANIPILRRYNVYHVGKYADS